MNITVYFEKYQNQINILFNIRFNLSSMQHAELTKKCNNINSLLQRNNNCQKTTYQRYMRLFKYWLYDNNRYKQLQQSISKKRR